MNHNVYLYILVMAGVTYLIRLLPLTLIKKEIKNVYVKSFLYYVPYVTLSVMTFPAILHATASVWSGAAALAVAVLLAWKGKSLFQVSLAACAMVFLLELFLSIKPFHIPGLLQRQSASCPCPPVHDGMDDRNHEYGHDSACITVIIQVHAPIHDSHIEGNGGMQVACHDSGHHAEFPCHRRKGGAE